MGKHQSDYEHVEALPLSTRDADGLLHGENGNRRIGTFDVEFDVEDDILLDWQKHGSQSSRCSCCSWWVKLLPERFQEPPSWWWHLSRIQRNSIRISAISLSLLLLALSILGIAYSVHSSSSSSSNSSSSSSSSDSSSIPAAGRAGYQPQHVTADSSPLCSWDNLYLPKAVQPSQYKLHIKTNMQEPYLVEGEVQITVQTAEATPCVVLHSKDIDIHSVKLLIFSADSDIDDQQPVEVPGRIRSVSDKYQQLVLEFDDAVPTGSMQPVLALTFSYTLTEGLDGFYRSIFVDAANKTKIMASTQFESIAARKAFPCFDEPAFKATFEIKISSPPPPVVVLSNMPLSHTHGGRKLHKSEDHAHADAHNQPDITKASNKKSGELITYHYQRSPPMSTYLVAWVVGELANVEMACPLTLPQPDTPWSTNHGHHSNDDEDDDKDDHRDVDDGERGRSIPVRVWGTTDRASQFGHAKEVACHSLQTMEHLLQVPYSLPKLDLVAIPNFAAGAMENWGLLMYRETDLLVDDSVDDINQRYDIATTVAHETAHQWFGDLVTLDDWTELWLNEGFATYFEVVVADAFRPKWGYFSNFFESTTSTGLEDDGVTTSHPLTISRPTKKLTEIDNWFDGVSYEKGGAVLRMLRAWLNRGNAPLLGFTDTRNDTIDTANDTSADDDGQRMRRLQAQRQRRHGRRLQQLLSQYSAENEEYVGSDAVDDAPWTDKEHLGRSTQLPAVVVGLSTHGQRLLQQEEQLEPGNIDANSENSIHGTADQHTPPGAASNSTSNSSGADWWTRKSHIGLAATQLQKTFTQLASQAATGGGREIADSGPEAPVTSAAPASAGRQSRSTASSKTGTDSGATSNANSGAAHHHQGSDVVIQDITSTEGSDGLSSGEDVFLTGLRSYLQDLSYQNASYKQLWDHLEKASGQPVRDMMNTWTLRRGFPIVSVSLQPAAGGLPNQQLIQFDQVPYHAPRSFMVGLPFYPEMYCNDWTEDAQDSSWWIPMALRTLGSKTVQWHSFSNCSSNITSVVPHNGWVIANTGRYGFYRVNYSEPLWNALASAAADRTHISSIDFAGLLDDSYSLSLVRQLNVTVFLSLTKALGERFAPEPAPWKIALGWLQRMTDVLSTAAYGSAGNKWKACLTNLKKYVTDELTTPFVAKVKIPGQAKPGLRFEVNPKDSPIVRMMRTEVLTAAGFLGHQQIMDQAVTLLKQVAAGQTVISPDVTRAVFSLAVGSGDTGAYETVQKLYEQATDPAAEERALRGLARASTAAMISKTLEYAISPSVRSQDVSALLVGLAKQGGLGFNMTWEFIMSKADDIQAKFGGGDLTYALGHKLNRLAKLFVDEDLLNRLKSFAEQHPQIFSPTFFDEANEARITNTDWLRLQGVDACAWLASAAAEQNNVGG